MFYYVVSKSTRKYVAGPFYRREQASVYVAAQNAGELKIVRTMKDIAPWDQLIKD